METSWRIRKYREDDIEQILKLSCEVWGNNISKSLEIRWKWELRENPYMMNVGPLAWVAEDKGKIVGYVSRRPAQLKVFGKSMRALFIMNLTVHPYWRKKGIGGKLIDQMTNETNGGSFIFSRLVDERVFFFFKAHGYDELFSGSFLNRPLNFKNILMRKTGNVYLVKLVTAIWELFSLIHLFQIKSSTPTDIEINRINSFDERIDKFWRDVCYEYDFIIERNREYLNWRFSEIPGKQYKIYLAESEGEIRGYIILSLPPTNGDSIKRGYTVDILAKINDEEAIDTLISKAIHVLRKDGADIVKCMPSNYSIHQSVLKRNGFVGNQKKWVSKSKEIIVIGKNIPGNINNIKNYFFTLSDLNM